MKANRHGFIVDQQWSLDQGGLGSNRVDTDRSRELVFDVFWKLPIARASGVDQGITDALEPTIDLLR
jgi:hypothetical protein